MSHAPDLDVQYRQYLLLRATAYRMAKERMPHTQPSDVEKEICAHRDTLKAQLERDLQTARS